MAITPEEARNSTDPQIQELVKQFERIFDGTLRHSYTGGTVWVQERDFPRVPMHLRNKVHQTLERVYKDAGWIIKRNCDQREGTSWSFKAKSG